MSTAQNLAAYLPAPCSPLNVTSAPSYVPNPGEILVCNYAFAIQPLDAKMHNSDYSGAGGISSYPSILGTNLAGVVHAVGDGVRRLKNGDRVIADTAAYTEGDIRMGAWQRFVIVREDTVAKVGCGTSHKGDGLMLSVLRDRLETQVSNRLSLLHSPCRLPLLPCKFIWGWVDPGQGVRKRRFLSGVPAVPWELVRYPMP